jgi:signal transduction histidine kinase
LWGKLPQELRETGFLLVTNPSGAVVAAIDDTTEEPPETWKIADDSLDRFPDQVAGFQLHRGDLYQVVLTPVYGGNDGELLHVLVAGFVVNRMIAQQFKRATGDSEFLFVSRARVYASTMNDRATGVVARRLALEQPPHVVGDGTFEYVPLERALVDLEGKPAGKLYVLRSFEGARQSIAALRRQVIGMWLVALAVGLAATYALARKIVKPIQDLDRAAAQVAAENYNYRVKAVSQDELGRLASTFNMMCASLQSARAELIRQERITTIGRLASSIVHDLRNPLAAIYGGAEMLVDTEPTPDRTKRLAGNIYRASRRIQELLQDLTHVTRGRTGHSELCTLRELILSAVDPLRTAAEGQGVRIAVEGGDVELHAERARLEGVFFNLVDNALGVLPKGGEVRIESRAQGGSVVVEVADTGPGIAREIRGQLFQPFVTHGKKNGLGLGLALARQTVLDHGGDMWVLSEEGRGARFYIRLPLAQNHSERGPRLPTGPLSLQE